MLACWCRVAYDCGGVGLVLPPFPLHKRCIAAFAWGWGNTQENDRDFENLVKAKVGKIIHLPCCHELPSPESQYNYRVYWQTEKEVVMAYSAGKLVRTDAKFVNRTKMDLQNLTMSIFPVKLSDTDTYKCIVQVIEKGPSKLCDRTVDLVVEADFSKPVISADVPKDACGSTEVTVNCYSHGGFPAPRVSGILNNMSVDWQTNLSDSKDSLYNVTAKLQLNLTEDIFLTCTIEYDDFEVSSNYILSKFLPIIREIRPPLSMVNSTLFIIGLLNSIGLVKVPFSLSKELRTWPLENIANRLNSILRGIEEKEKKSQQNNHNKTIA
uniref:Ig-like domain-containing protein n=1 Tax=Terrapene triunguis TaxID=2587831 RepID=A0A674I7Y0_9SAUR